MSGSSTSQHGALARARTASTRQRDLSRGHRTAPSFRRARRPPSRWRDLRYDVADALFVLGVTALLGVVALVAISFAIAAVRGQLPFGRWGEYWGNHGPWHHSWDLALLMASAMVPLPEAAACCGLASFLVRPTWRAAGLILTTVAMFFLVIATFGWLVD
jgi:hypothetical protein